MRKPVALYFLIACTGLALSLGAFALSSGEKRAIHQAEAQARETVSRVRMACGNPELRFDFDWKGFSNLDYTQGGLSRERALLLAGDRANRFGNAMIAVCFDNPKGKAEVATVKSVEFTPQSDAREFHYAMTRSDGQIHVRFGAFGVLPIEDLPGEIKKLFP